MSRLARGLACGALVAGLGLGSPGCTPGDRDALVVASPWPPAARAALTANLGRPGEPAFPITWVDLGPGDRPAAALARRGGVDLVIGVAPEDLADLAESGSLEPIAPGDPVPWRLLADRAGPDPGPDPRDDPARRAQVVRSLRSGDWAAAYAGQVRRAAEPPADAPPPPPASRAEAVALVRSARHPAQARRFLAALDAAGPARPGGPVDPAGGLMADLVGSTVIDAAPELRAAWAALVRYGHPAGAEASFTEAPPWPPASVRKLRLSSADAPLLETLADQVAPDPEARAWLVESWNRPSRPLRAETLDDLAAAAGGRVAREPRFRAWLRAEWTAWARQRYRRVARVAAGWSPS